MYVYMYPVYDILFGQWNVKANLQIQFSLMNLLSKGVKKQNTILNFEKSNIYSAESVQ